MAATQQIADEIMKHVKKHGGTLTTWYIGITDDPKRRGGEHNALGSPTWGHAQCASSSDARTIENYFLGLGMSGGPGGGDTASKYVYVYQKSRSTVEGA